MKKLCVATGITALLWIILIICKPESSCYRWNISYILAIIFCLELLGWMVYCFIKAKIVGKIIIFVVSVAAACVMFLFMYVMSPNRVIWSDGHYTIRKECNQMLGIDVPHVHLYRVHGITEKHICSIGEYWDPKIVSVAPLGQDSLVVTIEGETFFESPSRTITYDTVATNGY